jgi:hypothetical protein
MGGQTAASDPKEHVIEEVAESHVILVCDRNAEALAIRPLPERATVYGHELNQVWRKENVAIFARSRRDRPPHEYEVVIIKLEAEGRLPNGTTVPARYAYPCSSAWGKLAWSVSNLEDSIRWAEIVLSKLREPARIKTSWPILFARFKE